MNNLNEYGEEIPNPIPSKSKVTVEVDRELYKRFKAKTVMEGTKVVDIVTKAMKDYLEETVDHEAARYKEDKINLEFIERLLERTDESNLYPFLTGVQDAIIKSISEYESERLNGAQ